MKDDELEAVFRKWAEESKYEDLRREWEEEQAREREPEDTFRSMCGIVALVMILVWLVGCQAPVQVADSKPRIPRDIRFVCHPSGDWAVVSESAGEAFIHKGAAPCGKKAI